MRKSFHFSAVTFLACLAGAGLIGAEPTKLMETSPFLPAPGTAMPGTEQSAETLEFAGVSVGELQTLVSLYDTKEKRGRWIAVGTKADGIEVVSYDVARDQVVIREGAGLKVLTLRRPGKVTGAPAFSPAPVAVNVMTTAAVTAPIPPASNEPKKPLTIAQQEEEARMFVADMLDIGMQHRKAYEEAQKKAAAEKASGTATPPPAPTPAGG